jgi:hypothetical protein
MQRAERTMFVGGVDELFDARLKPVVDQQEQARTDEERLSRRDSIARIVAECRSGEYGGVASQAIETLRKQAKTFIDVEKGCHGIVSRPDPQTKQYQNQEVQRAWAEMQLTMMKLERLGVEWGDIPEWEVAAMLVSFA